MKWLRKRLLGLLRLMLSRFGPAARPGATKSSTRHERTHTSSSGKDDSGEETATVVDVSRQNTAASDVLHGLPEVDAATEMSDETETDAMTSAAVATEAEGVTGLLDRQGEEVDSVSPEPPAVEEAPLISDFESAVALENPPVPETLDGHEMPPNVKAEAVAPDMSPGSTASPLLNTAAFDQPEADNDAGPVIRLADETVVGPGSETGPTTEQPPVIEEFDVGDPALADEPESEVTTSSPVSPNAEADAVAKKSEVPPTRSPAPVPPVVDKGPKSDAESVIEPTQDAWARKLASDSPTIQRHTVARRSPSSRRPAPTEAAEEFSQTVNDISTIDWEYTRWNNAIVEYLLLGKPASENIYLCVTPRVLATVSAEAGLDSLTPEQAAQRFSAAVANVYRRRVLGHSERLRVLRRCGEDGSPDCAAFLGASVLVPQITIDGT